MKAKLPNEVLKFAKTDDSKKLYFQAIDYYNHYMHDVQGNEKAEFSKYDGMGNVISLKEKEERLSESLLAEVAKFSQVPVEGLKSNPMMYSNMPSVVYATFAIVSSVIDAVLPQSIIESTGAYTEVRTVGYGDSAVFDIRPRDLFAVSLHGHKQRQAELHKQYSSQVILNPENHELSVYVDMYRVLCGLESLGEFMVKVARSIETEIAYDAYMALETAMAAIPTTPENLALRATGYTQDTLVSLGQRVQAWNFGRRPIVLGTKLALSKVLPEDANYRYTFDSDYVRIGYMRTAFGYDLMELPQVADWTTPFDTLLNDNRLYIISPSSDKIVKLVFGGDTITTTSGVFDYANLIQTGTMIKAWKVGVATNSVAAVIDLV